MWRKGAGDRSWSLGRGAERESVVVDDVVERLPSKGVDHEDCSGVRLLLLMGDRVRRMDLAVLLRPGRF